jgi:hypothetical protein
MTRLLVLHRLRPRSRQTTVDHLLSFGRYLDGVEVVYHGLLEPGVELLEGVGFDGVILNYDFLGYRAVPLWDTAVRRFSRVVGEAGRVVAVPQDDYTFSGVLDEALVGFGVDAVYSPLESGLELIYPKTLKAGIPVRLALTGYVDPVVLDRVALLALPLSERPIDIGHRVKFSAPQFGRHARKKGEQAVAVAAALQGSGLVVDISVDPADVFFGDEWFRFLGSCRFTLGHKGGASLFDRDGSLTARVNAYVAKHPEASFDEVEAACFAGSDGHAVFSATGPRIFDAAMMRTCQILSPDDYLGVLEPWVHYLPLEEDLSNLGEVVAAMRDDDLVERVADAAFEVLIASGDFDYSSFARGIFETDIEPFIDASRAVVALGPYRREVERLQALQVALPPEFLEATEWVLYYGTLNGTLRQLKGCALYLEDLATTDRELLEILDEDTVLVAVGSTPLDDPWRDPYAVEALRYLALNGLVREYLEWIEAAIDGRLTIDTLRPWVSMGFCDSSGETVTGDEQA